MGEAAVAQAAARETARTRRPKRPGRRLEERRRNRFAMGTPGCALLAWVEFVLGSMVDGRTPSVDGVLQPSRPLTRRFGGSTGRPSQPARRRFSARAPRHGTMTSVVGFSAPRGLEGGCGEGGDNGREENQDQQHRREEQTNRSCQRDGKGAGSLHHGAETTSRCQMFRRIDGDSVGNQYGCRKANGVAFQVPDLAM